MPDPHRLSRFVEAQAAVYADVRAELQDGRKRSHWMWFVFPQLVGLGRSETARHFGIASIDEARAYAAHPLLGPRLVECCDLLLAIDGRSATAVLGSPDDLKLRSSMTLFAEALRDSAAQNPTIFSQVLQRYFSGHPDPATLALLQREG